MNTPGYKKIISVNGTLQAAALYQELEMAGIPVITTSSINDSYLDVLVPVQCLFDAQNLLNPERRSGEIFFVPAGTTI
jgi:hypothetical protein